MNELEAPKTFEIKPKNNKISSDEDNNEQINVK